jgi:hypothetical protein
MSRSLFLATIGLSLFSPACDGDAEKTADPAAADAPKAEAAKAEAPKEEAPKAEPPKAEPKARGQFVGTIGEEKLELAVDCKYFDQPHFTFLSDKFDHKDSDGDGVVLSGMEHDGKFVLTYIVEGKTFSTPKLKEFAKKGKKASGEGVIDSEDFQQHRPVSFEVSCP